MSFVIILFYFVHNVIYGVLNILTYLLSHVAITQMFIPYQISDQFEPNITFGWITSFVD